MDMGEKEKSEDHMNYSAGLSSDWKFDGASLTNTTSMGLVQPGNSMAIGSSSCSSAPMADGFVPAIWDHPNSSQSLGFCDGNSGAFSAMGIRKGGWAQPNSMVKGGTFLPNLPGVIPPSLSQLPADSAFIERAARFSSFNGGNFTDMMNPFAIPETTGIYMRNHGMIPGGGQEVFAGGGFRHVAPGMSSQRAELCANEGSRDASVAAERANNESPLQNERKSRSLDEAKPDKSDEAELSSGAGAGQDESAMFGGESSGKELSSKKRKRIGQDSDPDRSKGALAKEDSELQSKGDQNPSPKTAGKTGKQGSQASDPAKEDYIHVRARRGQATNSHSLAERVRREKISERMKFLQDLVPGCSKVTGKAVMLDEIINYVQSLQRQVEFLSMKLATVNPRLDFNIGGLLTKDMLQSRVVGSSPSLTFAPDMPMAYPSLQQGLIQPGIPGMGGSSDALRRAINSHLTPLPGAFKEPSQIANMWEDELNNVVQMSFGARTSPSSPDVEGSLPGGHMKVEL